MKSGFTRMPQEGRRRRGRRRVGILASTATTTAAAASLLLSMLMSPSAALVVVPRLSNNYGGAGGASTPSLEQLSAPALARRNKPARISHHGSSHSYSKSLVICRYADEWADAGIELAFQNGVATENNGQGTSSSRSKFSDTRSPLRRLLLRLSRTLYLLKESVRTRLERCTVYVLECESGKYYVGSTTNRKRRYREHKSRKGSKWTRSYKPIKVLREYRRIPSRYLLGMESKVTAECMLEFGVNNVRGSMFCSNRDYHAGDADALTKFLGHYNGLNYRKVNRRLSRTLPASPERRAERTRRKSAYERHMEGRCYRCGREGHFAASCPEKQAVVATTALRP